MKNNKKIKENKSLEARVEFVKSIKDKINNLGIPETYQGIQEFYKVLDEYQDINNTNGFSGKIKIHEISKKIDYILPIRSHIEPVVKIID
jgi:hypothetical protein